MLRWNCRGSPGQFAAGERKLIPAVQAGGGGFRREFVQGAGRCAFEHLPDRPLDFAALLGVGQRVGKFGVGGDAATRIPQQPEQFALETEPAAVGVSAQLLVTRQQLRIGEEFARQQQIALLQGRVGAIQKITEAAVVGQCGGVNLIVELQGAGRIAGGKRVGGGRQQPRVLLLESDRNR